MTDIATKLASLAERQLGVDPDLLDPNVAEGYLKELEAHLRMNPNDDNFAVEMERGEPRTVLCLETGCDGKGFVVERRNGPARGISLERYRDHIRNDPTHAAMRDDRVQRQGPTFPTTTTTSSRPRPRPVTRASVKKEDMPPPATRSSSRKRSYSTMLPVKTEPKPVNIKAEPNDVIDLSEDHFLNAAGPSNRPLKRQKTLEDDPIDSKPLSSLANRPASVDADKQNIRDEINELQAEILGLERRLQIAKRKSGQSKPDKTRIATQTSRRNALMAEKAELERRYSSLGSLQSSSFTSRSFNGTVKNEPVEPPLPVASSSRVTLPPAPTVKAEPLRANLPVKREPNAVASGSRARQPPAPGPAFLDFDDDVDVKSDVLNAAVEAPAPAGGKPRDPDDLAPPPDPYRDDPYDEEGNYFGRGRDTFVGPQAQADDLDKFLVAAGNAELFDGNETVGTALKALKLPDLTSTMPGMSVALMPHQVIGVAWMLQREASNVKGGCLADEMGLGKTVQTIATMVANYPKDRNVRVRTTLILAPLALLPQWQQEIADKTDGSFKTLIYHGNNKPRDIDDFQEYDFVLTTLNTLALEWPDPEEDTRREKKEKKGKAKAKSMGEDFIVDDDSDVPVPVKANGKNKGKGKQKKLGALFRVAWLRVVVDEAHMIKNKKTRVSRAVTKLIATYRWALTGTPIVNSLQDAYGTLRFLQVRPWYDWKEFNDRIALLERKNPKLAAERLQSIFKTVQLRRKKDSKLNGKPLIELPPREVKVIKIDFSQEERDVYTMIERNEQAKFNRFLRAGTVLKNYHQIFVMILRLRQLCSHPSLIQDSRASAMIVGDGDDDLTQESKDELSRAQELLGINFVAKVKDQRLQLARQRIAAEKNDVDATVEEEECAICLDSPNDAAVTQCGHIFCRECIMDVFTRPRQEADGTFHAGQDRECPNCRGVISQDKLFSLAAFEPTDFDLNPKFDGAKPSKFTAIDSDIEMLDDSDVEIKPARKGKGKAKERIQPGRSTRRRVSYIDSEDDDEHSEIDDDLSDFIIDDDDDEDEHEARRALQKKLAPKSKAPVKKVRRKGIVLDSEDEFESEEEEVVFGKPKKETVVLDPEEVKLMPKFLPSAKMKHMMDTIVAWNEQHPDEKTLIISQWTSCLDLISNYLIEKEVVHVQYRGDMTLPKRETAVRVFQSREKARIMLMSRACGGVGLNLTRGNRVICMDLAWSEAVENQAWSRVHRLGQQRPVFVERFIIKDTIEDRILAMQEKKRLLADGSLGEGDGRKLGRLSVRELAALFNIGV